MEFEHPHLHPGAAAGRTLRGVLAEKGPLGEKALLRMVRELAEGLSWLHAAGRRHGRLSPDAVFFDAEGKAVLALEAPVPDADRGWVPFEKGAGRDTPASDLYQLGATALFAATGKDPVSAGLPLAYSEPPGLAGLTVPARDLVNWLVEPRWDRRPQDAALVAGDAREALQGRPISKRRRRRGRFAAGAGIGAAALGLWLGFASTRRPAQPPTPWATAAPATVVPGAREAARQENGWSRVTGPYPDVMRLRGSLDGGVWVVTKYDVTRFRAGLKGEGERALAKMDPDALPGLTGHHPTWAAGTVDDAEVAWVGTWDGFVAGYDFAGRKLKPAPPLAGNGRVDDLAVQAGVLFSAYRGEVRSWSEGRASWDATGAPSGMKVLLVTRSGGLFAGGAGGVWTKDGLGWRRLWKAEPSEEAASLSEDDAGRLLVGTRDGLVTLEADGSGARKDLAGHTVTCAAPAPGGRLWVGTWDAGLFLRENGVWHAFGYAHGLPANEVHGVAVDREGLLWVGLYGGGVLVRTEAEAAAAAGEDKAPGALPGRLYQTLTEAAQSNAPEGTPTGGVLRVAGDGRDEVFFGGRQTTSGGLGASRPDGTWATWERHRWRVRRPGAPETEIPAQPMGGGPTAALFDSKGRLWVGTYEAGVMVYVDGVWRSHGVDAGLDGARVTALAEDAHGGIWVTASPSYDPASRKYLKPSLSRFDGTAWKHWTTEDGLGYAHASDVRALPDGSVAVATNGGLSLVTATALRTYKSSSGLPVPYPDVAVPAPGDRLVLLHRGLGLSVWDGRRFHRVTSREGLFSDRLRAAAFDADGRLWLAADDGRAFILPAGWVEGLR